MIDLLKLLGGLLVGVFRSHAAREAEMAFLRQQPTFGVALPRCPVMKAGEPI
jgi:hypothetical protein